jgi:hypothetical protein
MDLSRILLLITYIVQTLFDAPDSDKATTFSMIILISILGVLNFLRYYETFRSLIDLILSCAGVVSRFSVVFIIMILSLTAAQYYKKIMSSSSEEIHEKNFLNFFQEEYFNAFGDFGNTEAFGESEDVALQWSFFALGTLLCSLLMMNLLIGIISEKLGEVLSSQEKTNYSNLCDMVLELELLMFWNRQKDPEKQHIIWAQYVQEKEGAWHGATQATIKPIETHLV